MNRREFIRVITDTGAIIMLPAFLHKLLAERKQIIDPSEDLLLVPDEVRKHQSIGYFAVEELGPMLINPDVVYYL